MKKHWIVTALALTSVGAWAQQETARVISVTPIMQQVSVPRQVCSNETVVTGQQKSGAGAAMGAIAGGAMGNAVGGGGGKAAATMIGIIGGAILGDSIEGGGTPQTQNVQRCTTQNILENRITGYSVIYEFGGKQYTVQMPQDPGPTIKLQLTPIGAAPATQVYASAVAMPEPAAPTYSTVNTTAVVMPAPQPAQTYASYNPAWYVVPAVALGLSYVWSNGVYRPYRPHHRH